MGRVSEKPVPFVPRGFCAVELLMCTSACLVFCEMHLIGMDLVALGYKNNSFLKAMAQLILNLTAILH